MRSVQDPLEAPADGPGPTGRSRLAVSPRALFVIAGAVAIVLIVTIALNARTTGSSRSVTIQGPNPSARSAATATQAPTAREDGSEGAPVVVVHVLGAVAAPGLFSLPAASRVEAALRAAGGATDAADLARVNLARALIDGEQLYVPALGESSVPVPLEPNLGSGAGTGVPGGSSGTGADSNGIVRLNAATAEQLATLPGIGPALAERILVWRDEHHGFSAVEDLLDVSGIGATRFADIKDRVTL